MVENTGVDLLNDAFNIFKTASFKLEQQYALLENRIEELTEELAEKNRMMERSRRLSAMGEMAAKIAHEIRNPLGSMNIFATILERELENEPERKRLALHITKGIKTLDNLLTNMLLFASAPVARLKPVDVKEIIEDSIGMAAGRGRDGVGITTDFCGPTAMMGDHAMLRQLFLNLFINSLDAVKDAGTISVRTSLNGQGWMEIEVRDTGGGIDKDHLDRIFDPFFSTKDSGTGLGLAIVSTVVNAHSGAVEVESAPGKGTAFLIRLPAALEGAYL